MEASWGDGRDPQVPPGVGAQAGGGEAERRRAPGSHRPCRHEPDGSARGRRRRASWETAGSSRSRSSLLAPRVSGESGGDVLARFAQALRGVRASKSSVSLVMCDTLEASRWEPVRAR